MIWLHTGKKQNGCMIMFAAVGAPALRFLCVLHECLLWDTWVKTSSTKHTHTHTLTHRKILVKEAQRQWGRDEPCLSADANGRKMSRSTEIISRLLAHNHDSIQLCFGFLFFSCVVFPRGKRSVWIDDRHQLSRDGGSLERKMTEVIGWSTCWCVFCWKTRTLSHLGIIQRENLFSVLDVQSGQLTQFLYNCFIQLIKSKKQSGCDKGGTFCFNLKGLTKCCISLWEILSVCHNVPCQKLKGNCTTAW